MTIVRAADGEPTWPYPPRYWWLKRVSLGALLTGLVLAGAWEAWQRQALRRLRVETDAIVAAGDPVTAADLNPPPVPDSQNGALLYLEAVRIARATRVDSPSSSSMTYPDYPPLPPRWHRMADRSAALNQPIFKLMRQTRRYQKFDWGVTVTSPAFSNMPTSHLLGVHHLANLAGDAALHAHLNGDDAGALEYVRDVLHAGAAVDVPPGALVAHQVRVYSAEGNVLYGLQLIAAGLTVAPEEEGGDGSGAAVQPTSRPSARPASRGQVRAFIAELLDDRSQADGLRKAFAAERAVQTDMTAWFGQNIPILRPMFDLDARRVLRVNRAFVSAASQDDFQAATSVRRNHPVLKQQPPPQTNLRLLWLGKTATGAAARRKPVDYTRLMSSDVCDVMTAGQDRAIQYDMDTRADRRLAAVSLAVQVYRADHAGQVPPALEALVPNYLPRLPADPFRGDGGPVSYAIVPGGLPGGGSRPIVYSVGPDGADDLRRTGRSVLPTTPCFGFVRGVPDRVCDLVRWAPPAAPDPAEAEEEQRWKDPAGPAPTIQPAR